jgi:hypothetical protein
VIVGLEKRTHVNAGDLSGQNVGNGAGKKSEPPYEQRSGVMPMEQRVAGRQKLDAHEPRNATIAIDVSPPRQGR